MVTAWYGSGVEVFWFNEVLQPPRERVTTLETLLENVSQRAMKEKEQTEDISGALAEVKASCISGFEELQALLKSILDANVRLLYDMVGRDH